MINLHSKYYAKSMLTVIKYLCQGPRSNFEIGGGGGGTISDLIFGGGTKHFFLLILYNFKHIGGGGGGTCPGSGPPTPRSLCAA